MTDYSWIEDLLVRADAQATLREFHGFLCGLACSSTVLDDGAWRHYLGLAAGELGSDAEEDIRELWREIRISLESPDLDFYPLLPEEDAPINRRVLALSEWCHGFLNGYGVGRQDSAPVLTDDCRELLDDFSSICRIRIPSARDAGNAEAMMELEEFVKIAVLNIFTDSTTGLQGTGSKEARH